MRKFVGFALAVVLAVGLAAYITYAQAPRSRLDVVRARGQLICGVDGGTPGFSFPDPASGRMVGFDADFCRAVAGFVDVPDVEFVRVTGTTRIPAVLAGSIDVAFRSATHTITRDDQIDFGPVYFFDGQRLLVRTDSRINGLDDLSGARIWSVMFRSLVVPACVQMRAPLRSSSPLIRESVRTSSRWPSKK